MTGPRVISAVTLSAVTLAVPLLSGCGLQSPPVVAGPGQPSAAQTSQAGASARVGAFIEVIGARIPVPAAHAALAEVAMTLVNTNPGMTAVLTRAGSPEARGASLTRQGRVTGQITIPVSAGEALAVGPPHLARLLLTGMGGRLRPGQVITLTLTFAQAGQVTLRVPVIP